MSTLFVFWQDFVLNPIIHSNSFRTSCHLSLKICMPTKTNIILLSIKFS